MTFSVRPPKAASRPGWRLGALVFASILVSFVALGVFRSAGAPAHSQAFAGYVGGGQPDPLTGVRHPMASVPSQPLGNEDDCKKRLSSDSDGDEYCSDLFLALQDLDAFWTDAYTDIAPKGTKYKPPKAYTIYKPQGTHTKCDDPATPDLYCTPAAYLFDGTMTINEPYLLKIHKDGDFGAMIVLAHEWGHHIQNLTGRLTTKTEVTYTIQFELQADCYAGSWSHYEDFDTDHIEPGDIDEAIATAFSAGDAELDDWQESGAHGLAQQRTLAYRTGYIFGGSYVCSDWEKYDGQPVIDLDKYALAITPPDEAEELNAGGYRITGGDGSVNVIPLTKLTSASAQSQYNAIAKVGLPGAQMLDPYKVDDMVDRGAQKAADVKKTSAFARQYELVENGDTYHGIYYVNLRGAGGTGVSIDVFDPGDAGSADWTHLQLELRYMIAGLSLK